MSTVKSAKPIGSKMEQSSTTVNSSVLTDKSGLRIAQAMMSGIVTLILLPPILFEMGATKIAGFLYSILGFLCHQRADRSFYLFGDSFLYPKERIWKMIPFDNIFSINPQHRFTCNNVLGCKFGVCSRCTGVYIGLLLGLIVAEFVIHLKIPKIIPILMLIPMALDGGIQTIAYIMAPEQGFYESTNPRRFLTGLFFGLGAGYLLGAAILKPVSNDLKT